MNVVIGVNNDSNSSFYGKNFYDISEIKTSALKSTSPEGFALHSADVMNSISKNSENVKTDTQIALEKASLLNTIIQKQKLALERVCVWKLKAFNDSTYSIYFKIF